MKKKFMCYMLLLMLCRVNGYSQSCNDPCELIGNGSFSDVTATIFSDDVIPFATGAIPCWLPSHGTPNLTTITPLFAPGGPCPNPGNPSMCYADEAFIWSSGTPVVEGEGIYQLQNFIAGRKYFFTYKIQRLPSNAVIDNFYVKLINLPATWGATVSTGGEPIPTPASAQTIHSVSNVNNTSIPSYQQHCVTVTPNSNYSAIWFYPQQNPGHNRAVAQVTGIRMMEVYAGADRSVCPLTGTTLGNGCSNAGVTYSWSPATGLSNPNIANPVCTLNNTGSTPITQTYTLTATYNCGGSPMTLTDQVNVTVLPKVLASASGNTNVCVGDSYTYTISNYNPSTHSYYIAVNGGTYTQTGSTLNVTWTTAGTGSIYIGTTTLTTPACTGNTSLIVNVNPLPVLPVVDGPLQGCTYGPTPYVITNAQSGVTYAWTVTGGTIVGPSAGTSVNINWTGGGGTITIVATSTTAPYCDNTKTMNIEPCCEGEWLTTYEGNYDHAWDMILYNSGSPLVSGQTIGINDVFYIDSDIEFSYCQIYLGPDARIVVDPSRTVKFTNSVLQACTVMWDGIYAGNTSRVDILSSYVYDAKNAVMATNGPVVHVQHSHFINNYIGLSYNNFAGTNPGSIYGSTFTWDPGIGGGLKPPYVGKKGFCGVKINNVFQLQVGNPSAAANKNYFSDMNYGVYAEGSYYAIVNNEFSGFNSSEDPANIFLGAAVYASGYHPMTVLAVYPNPDPTAAYIGKTAATNPGTFKSNTFINNEKGVLWIAPAKAETHGNTFTDHSKAGVWSIFGKTNKSIRITNNIMDNTVLPATDLNGIVIAETGVNASAWYYVQENEISNVRRGILIQNANKPRVYKNIVRVIAPLTAGTFAQGIYHKGTQDADIQNNYVEDPANILNTVGIEAELAVKPIEKCNWTKRTWIGMLNMGGSPNSKYTCNNMDQNDFGYYNFNGYMNNQFTGTVGSEHSAENQWNNDLIHIVNQFTIPVPPLDTWYTRYAPAGYSVNLPGAGGNNASYNGVPYETNIVHDGDPNDNPLCNCSNAVTPNTLTGDEEQERQLEFLQVMQNTDEKPEHVQWLETDALYRNLRNATYEIEAAELVEFIESLSGSNIALLYEGNKTIGEHINALHDPMEEEEIDQLKKSVGELLELQSGITAANDAEHYNQQFNVIRLNALLVNYERMLTGVVDTPPPCPLFHTFTIEELEQLNEIAAQCPYTTGNVVYEARALLYLLTGQEHTSDCEFMGSDADARNFAVNNTGDHVQTVIASEMASVHLPLEDITGIELQVMDASGKLMWTGKVNENPVHFNTGSFAPGTYLMLFSRKGERVQRSRLVVIK